MSDTKGLLMYFCFFACINSILKKLIYYQQNLRIFILYIFYIIFQCIGTLDWIRSEGHTGVIRYK